MASLKQQILKQGQMDKEAFSSLSDLIREARIAEATALETRIADGHFYWVTSVHTSQKTKKHAA